MLSTSRSLLVVPPSSLAKPLAPSLQETRPGNSLHRPGGFRKSADAARELEEQREAEARRREARKLARSDAHRRKQTRQVVQKFCDLIDDDNKEWKERAMAHSYPERAQWDTGDKIPW